MSSESEEQCILAHPESNTQDIARNDSVEIRPTHSGTVNLPSTVVASNLPGAEKPLHYLNGDIWFTIIKKVTSCSCMDLVCMSLTCKDFKNIGSADEIWELILLDKFPVSYWKVSTQIRDRCFMTRNQEGCFREGILWYLEGFCVFEAASIHLYDAVESGHMGATYMLVLADICQEGERRHAALTKLTELVDGGKMNMKESRDKCANTALEMWGTESSDVVEAWNPQEVYFGECENCHTTNYLENFKSLHLRLFKRDFLTDTSWNPTTWHGCTHCKWLTEVKFWFKLLNPLRS